MLSTIRYSVRSVTYTDSQTRGNYTRGIVANTEGARVRCSPVPVKGVVLADMGAVYGLESHGVTRVQPYAAAAAAYKQWQHYWVRPYLARSIVASSFFP
jgi:hypothetical protein